MYSDNRMLYTVKCKMYTEYCIMYTEYCIMYTEYCILYTEYCILSITDLRDGLLTLVHYLHQLLGPVIKDVLGRNIYYMSLYRTECRVFYDTALVYLGLRLPVDERQHYLKSCSSFNGTKAQAIKQFSEMF